MCEREKGRAGRNQITMILGHEGIMVAAGTVGAIMNKQGTQVVRMRAWKTTVVDPAARTGHIKNHMLDAECRRDFTATVPGTKLVIDVLIMARDHGRLPLGGAIPWPKISFCAYRPRCTTTMTFPTTFSLGRRSWNTSSLGASGTDLTATTEDCCQHGPWPSTRINVSKT